MVLVNRKDSAIYAAVKALGDVIYGMPTQVLLKKNTQIGPKSTQTIHNICLKLNSKLGGINQVISPNSRPFVLTKPVSNVDCFKIRKRDLFKAETDYIDHMNTGSSGG